MKNYEHLTEPFRLFLSIGLKNIDKSKNLHNTNFKHER
jgi:hypothetical protein